jgi:Zn-dependent protease with chaperone function
MAKENTIKYFNDISSKAWEHPADRAALAALKQIPGLDELIRLVIGHTTEKSLRLISLATAVRVSEKQFADIFHLFQEACARLDVKKLPELYIAQSPFINAGAVGVDNPFIILNSSIVEKKKFSEKEIMAILGHELGHCLSGHALYRTLLYLLLNVILQILGKSLPLADIAIFAIVAALLEWNRKSELSADRAGLLVVQDPKACYELDMKMAGGSELAKMDINEFFVQAKEYEQGGDVLDSIFKILNQLRISHPFPVLRLTELKTWVDSGAYDRILSGEYARKQDDKEDDVFEEIKKATDQYQEDLNTSKDPLAETVSKVFKNFEPMANQVKNLFDSFFQIGQKDKKDDEDDLD